MTRVRWDIQGGAVPFPLSCGQRGFVSCFGRLPSSLAVGI